MSPLGGDAPLEKKVANYLAWDKNEKTRHEIEELLKQDNADALRARMNGRLTFGTAGIRAPMGGGFARLNELTIIQVSHGFATHILNELKGREPVGVAIGYDGRYNSKRFADLAANVFIRNRIPVYIFSRIVATPLVSWATAQLKCDAGLMITASHNPKEDNGYKAYWSNGAQILGPHDKLIVECAEAEPEPRDEYWDTSSLADSPLFHSADPTIDDYYKAETTLNYFKDLNASCPLKFTYSAFHGVGYEWTMRMLREFGFRDEFIFSVLEQQEPNPDFPTIPMPNPEEGARVLSLSMKRADETGSSYIFANDPDADRLQLAERKQNGEWDVLTGNEMGTLLLWWVWKNWRAAHPDAPLDKIVFLNSAVSSQVAATMAKMEGFKNEITLTGFKWMGNRAHELRQEGMLIPLAWEESIGFMPGNTLEKDGVLAAGMFAEIAAFLHHNGSNMRQQLYDIYSKYGFHLVRSSYWIVPNPGVTKEIFDSLRVDGKYRSQVGKHVVATARDLCVGVDTSYPDSQPRLPVTPSGEMLTLTLENGSLVTLRASGTEPKLKYYIELKTAPGKSKDELGSILDELTSLEKDVVDGLLQPAHFGLIPRK